MPSMIHAQCGLRRNCLVSRRLAIGIAAFLGPVIAALCADWDREGAKRAWDEATRLSTSLAATPEPSRESYLKCINVYRTVYQKDPHFGFSDDAIFAAAKLHQQMGETMGDLESLRSAARLYQFLSGDYPQSPFCPEALLRLGTISAGPLGDQDAARDAYDRLRTRYRSSAAAKQLAAQGSLPSPKSPVLSVTALPDAPKTAELSLSKGLEKADGWVSVNNILFTSSAEFTRVNIVSDGQVHYSKSRLAGPDRVFFDIENARLERSLVNKTITVGNQFIKQVRLGQNRAGVVRVVLDLGTGPDYEVSDLGEAFGIVINVHDKSRGSSQAVQPHSIPASPPASSAKADGLLPPVARTNSKAASENKPAAENPVAEGAGENPAPAKNFPGGSSSGTAVKDLANNSPAPTASSIPPPAIKTALPTRNGDRTMTRMLGLKIGRIVLDPGHGGHDTGTVGPGGLMEKDLVLHLAKELKILLEDNLGAEVIMTRTDDTFISLEERTAIANQHKADLFLSIHANSAMSRNISGVETYFLDFARTDAAREVAARENATTDHNIRDLQNLIRRIAQADKMEESKELAAIIQKNLYGGMRKMAPTSQNRGVRSAPFIVLIGADMPSVLAEVAFLSNPRDEKLLKKDTSRRSLAGALFQGIQGYMKTLGTDVAQNRNNRPY